MNTQPLSKFIRERNKLNLIEVFYTLQGEGPFAGVPAVFIRLAGCNLQCPGCDTDYTTGARTLPVEEVYDKAVECATNVLGGLLEELPNKTTFLFVITGGEPFLQTGCGALAQMLSTVFPNAIVQVETNGILEPLWNLDIPGLEIVVSPKTNHVAKAVGDAARAWKYVGKAGNLSAYDGLPIYALDNRLKHGNLLCRPFGPGEVYLQPYDEKDPVKNAANLEAVTKSCLKYGYRLSVQLHKLAGIP